MKGMQGKFFQLCDCITKLSLLHANTHRSFVCDESPKAINACTAEQSFGSRFECDAHTTDRRAREDTMTMKPQLDTFLTVHFTQRKTHTKAESQTEV